MRVCFNTDSGKVNCNFNDSDICGYTDQSVGEIGWTRRKSLGKFANCILYVILFIYKNDTWQTYSRFFSFFSFFSLSFFPVMLYYSYTLMFSLLLQHCCYGVVCRFVRSMMAFVCQEIKGLLTYLLNSNVAM